MSILQMRKQAQEDPGWLTGLMGAGLDWGLSFRGGSPLLCLSRPKGKDILGRGRALPML